MKTKDEIQTAILNICKVPMHSGDFNIVAFDSFCNKLMELGAEKEREENRSYIYELERELEDTQDKLNECLVADYMKKVRGQE